MTLRPSRSLTLAALSACVLPACVLSACVPETPAQKDDGNDPNDPIVLVEGECLVTGDIPPMLREIPCTPDFMALASSPLDATLPGARSVKVVLDTLDTRESDDGALYFQNSTQYLIHYEFVSAHLSGGELPLVPPLDEFNRTEYFSPERRFVLGAVTRYDGPDVWALEIAPYDTASAAMITRLFDVVASHAFFGPALAFHPTSTNVEVEAALLEGVPIVTTEQIYAGIDYQPLSLGSAIGELVFKNAAELEGTFVPHESILVLDQAPNDLSVVQGIITEEFQTPLSHLNVLAQNRRTPNMGLRGAMSNTELRALEGKLVELVVTADSWSVREATLAEAEEFWAANRPEPVTLPALDLVTTAIIDVQDVTLEPTEGVSLRDAIRTAVRTYGGKAAHYSILARTDDVPVRDALAVPVAVYMSFLEENGIVADIEALIADEAIQADSIERDAALADIRARIMAGALDPVFEDELAAQIGARFAGKQVRFRSSTNSEDLDGFPCAGCYESHTGDPTDWDDVRAAIKETYASAWLFRTYEERSYYGVDHLSVGMALLVHANFPDEEANGVAVTNNPFDASGLDPAFFVNVQTGGDAEVVHPPPGVSSDQLLYWYAQPNQPTMYLTHSSLIAAGQTVLTSAQLHELGTALDAIHVRFSDAYGSGAGVTGWYAMDIEFKLEDEDSPDGAPHIVIKQARPYPGRGE